MDRWQKTIQLTVRLPIVTPWAASQKVLGRQENGPLIFNQHDSQAESRGKADPLTTPVLSLPIFFDTIYNSLVVDNLRSLMTPFDSTTTRGSHAYFQMAFQATRLFSTGLRLPDRIGVQRILG